MAFSPDGKSLVSGSHDGTVSFWDVDWQSRVCEAVGRNLTEVEWKRYMPAGLLYHQTCPKWPAENPDTVKVSVYSSKSEEDWINAVTAAFNAAQVKTASGKTVVAAVTQVNSGGSMRDILDGKIQPTVWSPGDQSWLDQANQIWGARTGRPLISEKCAPTVYDPIGFAMWRPMAEALGWPDQPIGWDNFAALAADPQGWGAYGHPEWGQFKFGHTLPDFSNSGLLIMTALAYDVLGWVALRLNGETTVVSCGTPQRVDDPCREFGHRGNEPGRIDRPPFWIHVDRATGAAEVLR